MQRSLGDADLKSRKSKPNVIGFAGPFLGIMGMAVIVAAQGSAGRGPQSSQPVSRGATLTYRHIFKGSYPEFVEIKVREDSDAATYEIRQLDDDSGASPFTVDAPLRTKIFALAAELNRFAGQDLDVKRKVANLGQKTFRWEQGADVHEVNFNYTLNAQANQLMHIFEGLATQQDDLTTLQRRIKYDRLGVNDALLQIEKDLDEDLLPEPQELLAALDQIGLDSRIVDVARRRARVLAERIRSPKEK